MKHYLRLTLILLLVAMTLGSCKKKATRIMLETKNVEIAQAGGEKWIEIMADGIWRLESCPEWLKVKTTDDALLLKAEANTTGAPRECDLQLVGDDDVKVTLAVRQTGACTHINASPSELSFPKEGGDRTVTIDTDAANLNVEASEGVGAKYQNGKLVVVAPANEGGPIKGVITLTCDTLKTEIPFTVEGGKCPTCNGTGKVKCTKCGGRGVITVSDGYYIEYYGCTICGGRGAEGEGGNNLVKGSGRVTCPKCQGKGH